MGYKLSDIDKEHFIEVCNSAQSMAQAAVQLGMHFNTFKKFAVQFGCYHTNQSHKGISIGPNPHKSTEDILNGKYPDFQTYKLKLRLLDEGRIKDGCMICGWCEKRPGDKYSPCELHHKDGNRSNHQLDNLQLLCPNCHSLTNTYKARNKNTAYKEA